MSSWGGSSPVRLRAISPDGVPPRLPALGRYDDVVVAQERAVDDVCLQTTGFKGHRYAVVVSVTMNPHDMDTTDLV